MLGVRGFSSGKLRVFALADCRIVLSVRTGALIMSGDSVWASSSEPGGGELGGSALHNGKLCMKPIAMLR